MGKRYGRQQKRKARKQIQEGLNEVARLDAIIESGRKTNDIAHLMDSRSWYKDPLTKLMLK